MKQLFPWPGDRPSIVPIVADRVSSCLSSGGRFVGLFTGGAGVFFSSEPSRGVLSDARKPLMACYEAIQRDPVAVYDELSGLIDGGFGEDAFNRVKDGWNGRDFGVRFAAKFLYLSKVSARNSFFADVGQRFTAKWVDRARSPSLPSLAQLKYASSLLRNFRLYTRDYSYIIRAAHAGDVIYVDAPCWGETVSYGGGVFGEKEHRRLSRLLSKASDRGVRVFVSNIDCDEVRALYGSWADVDLLPVTRRGPGRSAKEVLFSAMTPFVDRNQLSLFEGLAAR